MVYDYVETPIGPLLVAGEAGTLKRIEFARKGRRARPEADWKRDARALREATGQLRDYFAGKRRRFELKLAPEGTEFQRRVWKALQTIPYGRTISYRELAEKIGNRKAVRAVGGANGRNPIPIVIPCHRVIGADGSLTGFGGGLDIKAALLTLEAGGATGRRVTGRRATQGRLRF